MKQETGLYDAFISYSRKDIDFARRLKKSLEDSGRSVWIDLEGIQPTTEWLQELLRAIERARAFLFLVSPDSVLSRFANLEVSHAVDHGKRIVPLLYRPIEDGQAPEEIGKRQWVDVQSTRSFSEVEESLLKALDLDPVWVDFHTRLTIRAVEWQTRGFLKDLLLRGGELQAALDQVSIQSDREPVLRQVHLDFVVASQRAERRRRIRSTLLVFGIVCSVAILGLFGLDRLRRDVAQRRSAAALDAIERPNRSNGFSDRGLLLAAGGYQVRETPATRSALLSAVQEHPRLSFYLHQHKASILAVGFVKASGNAVTVDKSGRFSIWNLTRPEVPAKSGYVAPPKGEWFKAQLDATGTRLAFGDLTGHIALCDLEVMAPCPVTRIASSGVASLSFNPRTRQLVSGHFEGELAFLSTVSPPGKPELYKVHSTPVHSLGFDLSGNLLASGEQSGAIYLWNLTGPKPVARLLGSHPLVVWNLAFAQDGQILASGDGAGGVYLWNLMGLASEPLRLEGNEGTILDLTLLNRRLAASDAKGNLLLWDLEERPPFLRATLRRHGRTNIWHHAFTQKGNILIGLDNEGRVSSWNLSTDPVAEETLGILDLPVNDFCEMVSVDPEREVVIAGDSRGNVALWHLAQLSSIGREERLPVPRIDKADFAEGGTATAIATFHNLSYWSRSAGAVELTDKLDLKNESIANLAISADGKRLAVGGIQKVLKLVDISGSAVDVHALSERSAYALSFSPDGRFLAGTRGSGGLLYLWDLSQSDRLLKTVELDGRTVTATAFDGNGRYLVTGEREGGIYVWKLEGFPQNPVRLLGHDAEITALTFSADSRILLTGDMSGKVLVWRFEGTTSEVIFSLHHQTYVISAAIDRASRFIGTTDLDGRVMLWDAREGLLIGELSANLSIDEYGNRMYPLALTFDEEGEELSALFRDGRRVTWPILPEVWVEAACRVANRRLRKGEHTERGLPIFPEPCEESRTLSNAFRRPRL